MKKLLLLAAVIGVAAIAPRAQAGISVGVRIGHAPVYVAPPVCLPPPPICVAPAPILVAPPVYYAPPPPVIIYGHHGYRKHYRHHHRHYYRHCR